MNIGDLVYRSEESYDSNNCDSGPPINKVGLIVDIISPSIFILWPGYHGAYVVGYNRPDWSLRCLKVINENR